MKRVAFSEKRFRTGENEKHCKLTSTRPCHEGGFFVKTHAGIFLILEFYIIIISFFVPKKRKGIGNKYDKIVKKAVRYFKSGTSSLY